MTLKVGTAAQGCIWPTSIVVLTNEPNLVVLGIDTQQKYIDCESDVVSQTRGQVVLSTSKRTLHLRLGDSPDESTYLRVEGLSRSKNWRTLSRGGRYMSTVVFYRVAARNRQKRLDL